jgi:type II secretory ATPase GspE/PulE/Tfp pilus assembly ATPase PilB-like protein
MSVAGLAVVQVGGYINPYAALSIVVLLFVWVWMLTWIDKDTAIARLPRELINSILFGVLIVAYIAYIFMPSFGAGMGVLGGAFAADIATYLILRHRTVGLADLADELKKNLRSKMGSGKVKVVTVKAGSVLIMDKVGAAQAAPTNPEAPDFIQYTSAQKLLTRPLAHEAEQIDMINGENPNTSYLVDGVKYDGEVLDRTAAGAAVQYLKEVAELDMGERRKPQTANFKAEIDKRKSTLQLTTYGSAQGESMRILVNPQNRFALKTDALGFTEEQLALIKPLATESGGLVILAAPKFGGLSALAYAIIRAHDAFLFHVHTIERAPELDLEGITQNKLAAKATGDEEAKSVGWVVDQQPDVIMITMLEDQRSAVNLAKFASDKKRVYVCFHASSTMEALKIWRRMVGDDALAMQNLRMVIAGRTLRRLCAACKVSYTPDPANLRKLNMDPASVGKLFQARKEPIRDAKGHPIPCNFCHDLAFKGRFGVYEVLAVDKELQRSVIDGGSENQIKQLMRKQKARLLQDIALAQVQAGETSVEEVLRVMKPEPAAAEALEHRPSPPSPPPASGPKRPAPTGGKPPSSGGTRPAARPPSSRPPPGSATRPPARG